MLDPDDRHTFRTRPLDQLGDPAEHSVALVSPVEDGVLQVHDEQRRGRAIGEQGHEASMARERYPLLRPATRGSHLGSEASRRR